MPRSTSTKARLSLAAVLAVGVATLFATRPLTAPKAATVEMADMTWIEIRDAIRSGTTTVLVPSGGIEANGPHMITDKHQHIVRLAARMIAVAHRDMLVAPVIPLSPQGDDAPATGNMRWPGTIGVPPEAFEAALEGVARSLKAAGFRRIVFMADHGGSQQPQANVAARLSESWRGDGVAVEALGAYYAEGDAAQRRLLAARGETPASIGDHAGLQDTAELLFAYPDGVKLERLKGPLFAFEADGSSGQPARATRELGEALIRAKVDAALAALRRPQS
jgi:creatinine amidohydrolase/Fe(II)-dependent formamide hydrolase-like protein